MRIKSKKISILGWIISIVIIAIALFYFNWKEVFAIFKKIKIQFLFLLLFIYIFDFILRAFRWKLLLSPIKKTVSLQKLFFSYNIAYFANIFLPVRSGELFRIVITSKEEGILKRAILGTLIFERILDILGIGVVISFLLFFMGRYSFSAGNVKINFLFWSRIFLIIPLTCILLILIIKKLRLIKRERKVLMKIIEFLRPIYMGFSCIHQWTTFLSIVILSIFMWFLNSFILYIYMAALSLNSTFFDSTIILVCQLLGEFIPSAPASMGTFHASTVIGAKIVGLVKEQGIVLALLNHSYDLAIRIILGLMSIHFLNFDFKKGINEVRHGISR
ncbi:MAG: flippase-like domain-containing protein [Candidatus Omnitrophica bacterium]|nr:flippase-like domain-containing protein [Candidatus Omnitrophota bacterium]